MQTLFKTAAETRLMKKSTTPPRDGNIRDTIFSYSVKSSLNTVTLLQKETGFSLAVEIEKLEETLRVTHFTLIRDQQLRAASIELYDAAEIEIMIQALMCVFLHAKRHKMGEVLFILPQREAIEISFFEGLFQEISSVNLGKEKRVSMKLMCVYQEYFFEKISHIKSRIYKELWVRQKKDNVLRNYLQNRYKENFSLSRNNLSHKSQSPVESKILAFPMDKKKPSETSDKEG